MGKKSFGGMVDLAQLSDKFQGKELRFKPPAARLSLSVSEYGKMAFVHIHKDGKNLSLSVSEYFTLKKAAPRIEQDIALAFQSIRKKGLLPREDECDQLSSVSIDECVTAMAKPPQQKVKKSVKRKKKIAEEEDEEDGEEDAFPPPKKSKSEKPMKKKTQSEQVTKIINDSHKAEEAIFNQLDEDEESDEE